MFSVASRKEKTMSKKNEPVKFENFSTALALLGMDWRLLNQLTAKLGSP